MALFAKKENHSSQECSRQIIPVRDALEVLSGRWKLPILIALSMGKKRFREISREIPGITDKMLSKELKHMEANQLVVRQVFDDFPPVVEYTITKHGESLGRVIEELRSWGLSHRKKIMGNRLAVKEA